MEMSRSTLTLADLDEAKYRLMQTELKRLGLSGQGNTSTLRERLRGYLLDKDTPAQQKAKIKTFRQTTLFSPKNDKDMSIKINPHTSVTETQIALYSSKDILGSHDALYKQVMNYFVADLCRKDRGQFNALNGTPNRANLWAYAQSQYR